MRCFKLDAQSMRCMGRLRFGFVGRSKICLTLMAGANDQMFVPAFSSLV